MPPYLESEEQFAQFLDDFDNGRIPRSDWNHVAHLAMAAARILESAPEAAYDRVKSSILRYASLVGIEHTADSGFHETITRFWTLRIQELLATLPAAIDALGAARLAVKTFAAQGRLFDDYYSFDVIKSRAARADYIPPDRHP